MVYRNTKIVLDVLFILFFLTKIIIAQSNDGQDQAIQLFEDRKYDEAKKIFLSLWEGKEDNAAAAYHLGKIYFFENNYDEAVDWLNEAVELVNNNSEYYEWLGNAYGRKTQDASPLKQPFLAPKVKNAYIKAIELDSTNLNARNGLIQYYTEAPGVMGGSIEKAHEQAKEIKKLDPVQGYSMIAYVYNHEEQFEKSEKVYQQGISENPLADRLYFELGSLYIKMKKPELAIDLANKVIQDIPEKKATAFFQRGVIYQSMEKFDDAINSFERCLETDPEFLDALYQIGRTTDIAKIRLDYGVKCFTDFLDKNKREGWAQWVHYRLGNIYKHQNKLDMAKAEYEKTLEIDPNHEQAEEALNALD